MGNRQARDVPRVVGIDFGTSTSSIAYVNAHGKVEVIHNSNGNAVTPSIVSFEKGKPIVGEEALKLLRNQSSACVANVKLTLGEIKNSLFLDEQIASKVHQSTGSRTTVSVDGRFYPAEEIAGIIFKYLKNFTADYVPGLRDAVITVPANCSNEQRQATIDAAEVAGFNVIRVLNEPTAAAIGYRGMERDKIRLLVFDLGGGTFDVSLLDMDGGDVQVIATGGRKTLGGQTFDHAIYQFADEQLAKEGVILEKFDRSLLYDCEMAKQKLSSQKSSTQKLPTTDIYISSQKYKNLTINRDQFEEFCEKFFQDTINTIDEMLDKKEIDHETIDRVIMVGGSSRIPRLLQLLQEKFGIKKVKCAKEPELAVVKGAAILAEALSRGGASSPLRVVDVVPMPLGLATGADEMTVVVESNTPLPIQAYVIVTNASSFDESLNIEILEGDCSEIASQNSRLALIRVPVSPNEAARNQLRVLFDVDSSGILRVKISDEDTGKEVNVTVETINISRSTKSEITSRVSAVSQGLSH